MLLPIGWLSERLGNRFYLILAVVLGALSLWALSVGLMRGMQDQVYDFILKNRFKVTAPSAVVMVDIDEESLASMASEYGRWPWPRSVMAELIEALSPAEPRAIVFDITFADPDINHPSADTYLSNVASRERRTYFAMIRLNPKNDGLSELRLSDLAGAERANSAASDGATVAMTVPYFYKVLDGKRLGTNNLYTGRDGVTRKAHVYRDVAGWRVSSLPASVVAGLGRPLPEVQDVLINWRGPPATYERLSFHRLYQALLTKDGPTTAARLRDKIVVIGSTAPSLFDIKATPMGSAHPGLEILATAIDNLYVGDFLRPAPTWIYGAISLLILSLLATAFVYNLDYRLLNPTFTVVQGGFVAVTYLYLNYSNLFVDLSAPFAAGFAYFVIARGYALALNLRRNGNPFLSRRLDPGHHAQVLLLRCTLTGPYAEARRLRARLLRQAGLTRLGLAAPRMFRQTPLLNAHYKNMLLVLWLVAPEETPNALSDLYTMLGKSLALLDSGPGDEGGINFQLDAFDFVVVKGDSDWRRAGRAALVRALGTSDDPSEGSGGSVSVLDSFRSVCRTHGHVAVPLRLQEAGMRIDE